MNRTKINSLLSSLTSNPRLTSSNLSKINSLLSNKITIIIMLLVMATSTLLSDKIIYI